MVAVQWSAWLTHTRRDPPTIEELRADLVRQKRVQMNAALLEAKEREERASVRAAEVPPPSYSIKQTDLQNVRHVP
ncbi:hypothetical protein ID866_3861 [Astraeus odoratus]|nr:hypothetical protein ID866_3861 [Astraeus odoratus]